MGVQLLEPQLLLMALLVLPLMAWHIASRARREGRVRFSSTWVLSQLPSTPRIALLPILDVLRVLVFLAIIVALARPAMTRVVEASDGAGIDLVLAVDISGSMDTRDLGSEAQSKSRLEVSKEVIQEFVSARKGDRIGLVAFAAEGVTVSPLTLDYTTLLGLLKDISFDRLPQGTAVGNGLAESVNLVREGTGKSRVVILLTDGRSTTGDISPETATKLAVALGVRTYTIGVGAPGITSFRSGMDEDGLRLIAAATGGAYFRAMDERMLSNVYATIDKLEKTQSASRKEVRVDDMSSFALLVAGLLLSLELLLRNTLFRRVA